MLPSQVKTSKIRPLANKHFCFCCEWRIRGKPLRRQRNEVIASRVGSPAPNTQCRSKARSVVQTEDGQWQSVKSAKATS